jgi:hypothetical protein
MAGLPDRRLHWSVFADLDRSGGKGGKTSLKKLIRAAQIADCARMRSAKARSYVG